MYKYFHMLKKQQIFKQNFTKNMNQKLNKISTLCQNDNSDITQIINSLKIRPYVISDELKWNSLKNKMITENFVILEQMGDIHPTKLKPQLNCETLVVNRCDKNFVYYWVHANIFINVKNIFLLSHPCEPFLFSRWYNIQQYYPNRTIPNIYLANNYKQYKNRWASDMKNVYVLDDNEIKFLKDKINILKFY